MGALATWPTAARQRLRWLRLTPFDAATAEGRSSERHRLIALSAAAAALSKVLGVASALLSIPLALSYLGTERFGIWSTLSTLVITLQFADLGIGNGLINSVSEAHGKGDRAAIRGYLSSGLAVLAGIALLLLLLLPAGVAFLPWASLFQLQETLAVEEVGAAMAVFVVCIALALPLGLVQRVQIGLQRGFVASLWQCVANLLSLGAIWGATQLQLGLPWLVLALLGAPLLTALFNGLWFFAVTERKLLPSARHVNRPAVKRLLSTGSDFLVLQLAVAVVLYSDSIVIAYVLGAGQVAAYAVPEKLFSIVSVLLATALSPLWPAYGEAIARGDMAWVTRTLKRSLVLAVVGASCASALLILAGPWLIGHWVSGRVEVHHGLLLMLGAWKVIECAGLALSMFLNGAGVLRLQVYSAGLMVVAAVLLKPELVRSVGVAGAPLATALIYLALTLLPFMLLLPGIVRRLKAAHPGLPP